MENLHTTREVAKLIGCCTESISRHARKLKIGQRISQLRVFTADEIELLRGKVQSGPGNPGLPRKKKVADKKPKKKTVKKKARKRGTKKSRR